MNWRWCFYLMVVCSWFPLEVRSEILLEVRTSIGTLVVYRPSPEEMERLSPVAKTIFEEAFATTYAEYYRQSGAMEPIETWLRLKEGLTLESWLSAVFEEECREYLSGSKEFICLCHANGELIGWLSHSPVSEKGELYLSQCSLEAASREQRVSTAVFAKVFQEGFLQRVFPTVRELKLITRKINAAARRLYINAGFVMDETIDPSVYGDCYDDRYVGYRKVLGPAVN